MQRFQRYIHMRLRSPIDAISLRHPGENTAVSANDPPTTHHLLNRTPGSDISPDTAVRVCGGSQIPYLRCPPHSQPERRIVVVQQEQANPMETVASVLTLLPGNRNDEAAFRYQKKISPKKKNPALYLCFFVPPP